MPDSITTGNRQNDATAKSVHTRSKFDLSYHFFDTMRFGELHPHFVMECVRGDKNVQVRSAHDVRSYSLKAPLMSQIQLKKDYFDVPMEAILPFNWDKIYTNPTIGDDVPEDAGTYIKDFTKLVRSFLSIFANHVGINGELTLSQVSVNFTDLLRWLLSCELFCSNGNLLSSLGIHLFSIFRFRATFSGQTLTNYDIDYLIDKFINSQIQLLSSLNNPSILFYDNDSVVEPMEFVGLSAENIRRVLDLCRDNLGTFKVEFRADYDGAEPTFVVPDYGFDIFWQSAENNFGLDIKRVLAYQIVCAHYYSNDFVDYIYSAELYREYIHSLFIADDEEGTGVDLPRYFGYNGINYEYDYLSSKYFNVFLNVYIEHYDSIDLKYILSYLQAIFGYRHSLRFMDYFVGSKTRPLAVGDTNVAVGPQGVNMVDTARGMMATRFYNAVNRFGRKFSNYLEGLIPDAKKVAPDYHNPFFLGHTADSIYGQEIENTDIVSQQEERIGLSVISNLRSNGSRYAFEFDADRPSIVIGISYFDVPRSYWSSIERQNFHKDRFDYFNPYMQFIGDQEIYARELQTGRPDNAFGYQLRHSEYKQRYNQCAGGFVKYLPGYTFLNDFGLEDVSIQHHISPSFIRSYPTEIDRFYISLTGYSLGSYFHFIVDSYNNVMASRPMAFAPSIL